MSEHHSEQPNATGSQQSGGSKNPIVRYYRGDVPLVATFWIYMAAAVVLSFFWAVNFILGFIISVYISTALWNSASKYRGPKIWKLSAQTVSVIGFTGVVVFTLVAIVAVILGIVYFA